MQNPIRKSLTRLLLAAVFSTLSLAGNAASVPESDDPIKLAINEWTGQHVTTYVAGEILQRMGYTVEYVTAGYYPQFLAMKDGSISATLEIWLSNAGEHFHKGIDDGSIISAGELNLKSEEHWYYPTYVEDLCPGLPDWNALNKCAELFASAETFPKGSFIDYPAEWGTLNVSRIDALKLDYVSVPSGGEGAMVTIMQSAIAKKSPIIMQFWTPHWLHAVEDMKHVVFPAYEEGCEDDPAVGPDPNVTFDCDWPSKPIVKVTWPGMPDKWPVAYKFLENYKMTNDVQIPLLKAIDVDGNDAQAAATKWVNNNEAVWKPWVDAAM